MDYSYNELMQMQEQAINRVREMQQRARKTAEESGDFLAADIPVYSEPPETEEAFEEKPVLLPKKTVPPPAQKKKPTLKGIGSLLEKVNLEDDTALLLPLIILLAREGADEKLLLALLYIMS